MNFPTLIIITIRTLKSYNYTHANYIHIIILIIHRYCINYRTVPGQYSNRDHDINMRILTIVCKSMCRAWGISILRSIDWYDYRFIDLVLHLHLKNGWKLNFFVLIFSFHRLIRYMKLYFFIFVSIIRRWIFILAYTFQLIKCNFRFNELRKGLYYLPEFKNAPSLPLI